MKKLILFVLLLVSVANAGGKHKEITPRSKVYDTNYRLKYRVKGDKVYDTNYKLQNRIKRNGKVYDTNYRLQYRIKRR